MKINSITTRNFMRLKSVHVDTSAAGVHLFCGPNESGKSSLKESVRIALIGTSPRVKHKKDHALLVTDGQRKGRVALKYQHEDGAEVISMHRNVDSENAVFPTDFRFDEFSVSCLNFALQIQSFADAKDEERRKLLNELFEIRMPAEKVVALLKGQYKVQESFVKHVQPLLRAGFEAAHKDAKQKMSNARGAWETATGENWGSEKVKTWVPPEDSDLVVIPPETLAKSTEYLNQIDRELERNLTEQGKLQAAGDARARLLVERDTCEQLKKDRKQFKAQRMSAVMDCQEHQSNIEDLQGRITLIRDAHKVLSCPNCDHKFHLREGELVPVDLEALDIGTGDTVNGPDLEKQLAVARNSLATRQRDIANADVSIERANNADARIAEIDAEVAKLAEGGDLDMLKAAIDSLRQDRANSTVEHGKLVAANAQSAQRTTRIAAAEKAKNDYSEWEKCVDALAPDGIPATLLLEQIAPINKRLEESAALAGWPRVQLNAQMELVRDSKEEKRSYALLSESAQWRAAALMADAIASLSGMKILVLDRMDVLTAGDDRAQCMKWLKSLAESDFHTIFVFATMKVKPSSDSVYGAQVHWMPDVISNQSTDK